MIPVKYDGPVRNHKEWTFLASEEGKTVYVPFEGPYESKGGRMQSPLIKLDKKTGESACYSIGFTANASGHCYWWIDLFDRDRKPLPDINSAVYPGDKPQRYDEMIYAGPDAEYLCLAFVSKAGVSVSDISIQKVSASEAASWCDKVYSELPALRFHAPPDSFRRLPKTAAALKNGTPWKIVMLGDSIMNDSYNSVFQALIQRDFPASRAEFIISVRGGTGCWHYETPENFREYVTKYKPDLLMIGGISNLNNDKSDPHRAMLRIGNVINQAKALGCEVILLSPANSADWRKDAKSGQAWNETSFEHNQVPILMHGLFRETAEKYGIAFWNMTVPCADYLADSGKPLGWFNRDVVHNNDRGKQIIGRVLREYFLTAGKVSQ